MAPVRTESPDGVRINLPWQRTATISSPPIAAAPHATASTRWSPQVWLLQCFLAAFGRQETQRQRLALFELEERQLKDIGLSRQEALDEAGKPFWK